MTVLSLKELEKIAAEAGFDAVGATTADAFPELVSRLEGYAERGRTGFEYEDIDLRVNPKRWFPDAKSLISVAMAYLTPAGNELAHRHPKGGGYGQVTVYSYGEDYHQVMDVRMKSLHAGLEHYLGYPVKAKSAIDTSPLVDRRVAERAGVGWIGKNCLLFTPSHGSFVFLGTLLVDIEIESGTPLASRCGTCTRCLDACPTGALIAPGVIDARRCLSYVTQMKGMIPEDLRVPLGRRVWGCDTCQWACPENKNVKLSSHDEYLPMGELEYPDLIEVLSFSNREFQRRYGKTAAAWRGVRTWQRNALIALGNAGNPDAVPHIIPFLASPRSELRASAAWALKQLQDKRGRDAVNEARQHEEDPEVAREMAWAAENVGEQVHHEDAEHNGAKAAKTLEKGVAAK